MDEEVFPDVQSALEFGEDFISCSYLPCKWEFYIRVEGSMEIVFSSEFHKEDVDHGRKVCSIVKRGA